MFDSCCRSVTASKSLTPNAKNFHQQDVDQDLFSRHEHKHLEEPILIWDFLLFNYVFFSF